MWKYVLTRLWLGFVTLIIILSINFILIGLLPFQKPIGNFDMQIQYYNTQENLGFVKSFEYENPDYGTLLAVIPDYTGTKIYYYETPLLTQYFSWVKNIVTKWDWGTSVKVQPNINASTIIAERLPDTIKLNLVATIISVPAGIALGILSALKKNSKFDNATQTGIMVAVSVPYFVVISILILVLAYNLKWVPSQWPGSNASLLVKMKGYIIPVAALSFGSIASYTRSVRAELCEVMTSEYLLLARTKGLTKSQAIKKHALKNAMVPIFPRLLAEVIGLLGGSLILENLYGINGIGRLFKEALDAKDYNVLFVSMAVFTTISLCSGIVFDLSYGFIDPRIRMGAKK